MWAWLREVFLISLLVGEPKQPIPQLSSLLQHGRPAASVAADYQTTLLRGMLEDATALSSVTSPAATAALAPEGAPAPAPASAERTAEEARRDAARGESKRDLLAPRKGRGRPPGEAVSATATSAGSSTRTTLYTKCKTDGLGVIVYSVVHAMGIAARYDMDYGGVVRFRHAAHGVIMAPLVQELFGQQPIVTNKTTFDVTISKGEIGDFRKRKPYAKTVLGLVEAALARTPRPRSIFVDQWDIHEMVATALWGKYTDEVLTPRVRSHLWALTLPALQLRARFEEDPALVAVHVRRGDIGHQRYVPNQWYFDVISVVRRLFPQGDVQAFSCVEGGRDDPSTALQEFRQRNVTVHLDKELLWDWAHFSVARVLVLSRSTYSLAPAVWNKHCIVWLPYISEGLSWWINGKEPNTTVFAERLGACLRSRGSSSSSASVGAEGFV